MPKRVDVDMVVDSRLAATVDGSEIPNNHQGCIVDFNYQPQLVIAGFLPINSISHKQNLPPRSQHVVAANFYSKDFFTQNGFPDILFSKKKAVS